MKKVMATSNGEQKSREKIATDRLTFEKSGSPPRNQFHVPLDGWLLGG